MKSTIYFTLLGIILVLQGSFADPNSSSSTFYSEESREDIGKVTINVETVLSSDSSKEFTNESKRNMFVKNLVKTIFGLRNFGLDRDKIILQKVVNDPDVKKIQTETMKEATANITDFVNKVSLWEINHDNEEDLKQLFEEYVQIIDSIINVYGPRPSPEQIVLKKAMEKHGFYDSLISKFLNKVNRQANQYIASLTPQEKAAESEIIKWHEELKNKEDLNSKLDHFQTFIDTFVEWELS